MGGAVSAGEDNEELVDKLVKAHYIKSPSIELFFRMIDRGFYFLPSHRSNAYRDQAWRFNSIHISAPCIYSEVLEALQVKPGMSFLNVGSGTGYLSTLVGLLLGSQGINHGIELNRDVLKYSQNKLYEFLKHSPALYLYDFVEPQFILGNAITILSDDPTRHQYDRVYCGAAVPPELESFMKSLLTIGGILVMPANDQLTQVTRISADEFESKSLLSVTFASLVLPTNGSRCLRTSRLTRTPSDTIKQSSDDEDNLFSLKIPENQPISLKRICRDAIIRLLRKSVESDPTFTNKMSSHIKLQSNQNNSKGKRFTKCLFHSSVRDVESRSRSHASSSSCSSDTSNSDSFTSNLACSSASSSSSATSDTSSVSMSSSSTGSSSTASSSDSNSLSTCSSGTNGHSSDEAAASACITIDDNQMASSTKQQPASDANSNLLHKASNSGHSMLLTCSSPIESTDTDDSDNRQMTHEMWRYNCIRKFVAQRIAKDGLTRERKADELAVDLGKNAHTSDPSPANNDQDDMTGESSSGDSGLSGVTGVASIAECSSKRSLSQTEEETGETATSGSSATGHVDSGRGSGLVSEPVLIARLRQRAIEGLRHRRRVKARRITIYSTDSDDSETQEATDSSSVATSSSNRRRGVRAHSDDAESTDSSEEERRKYEEANLLISPWSGNPLIPAIVKKINQLPLPPTLQVYVNFCRPLKGDS